MVNHGLITGALFLLVGVIYDRTHDRQLAKMGGLAGRAPVYAVLFGFFMFASMGLPGLSGFVSEFLVFLGSFAFYPIVTGLAIPVVIIGAAYLLWMYQRMFFGTLSDFFRSVGDHLTDITPIEIATLAPLLVLVVAFGLFPGLVLDLIQAPAAGVLQAVHGASPVALLP
jgi:NADH-quinone oxidoreductase subunit M